MDCPVSKADCQSPLLSSQARNLVSPLVFDAVESAMHIDTFNGAALPLNPVAMFKLRPKNRTPPRTKRSPPLGPSPLRAMILPECFDSDFASTVRLNGPDGMNTEIFPRYPSKKVPLDLTLWIRKLSLGYQILRAPKVTIKILYLA
ncbi:hypothetical protein M378DRAFT_156090 [Amanita muscaria Koide BX008]|uniref:Uncharacterized protein n=1 Tax=Amanita muscaria (strain Koide BX008) TaxID=946122 RepID=A0A0C2T2H9_AMAMK|nr:hypothetical protein M378DRAFT_156090 [Amanita muscaria Koide BX008]